MAGKYYSMFRGDLWVSNSNFESNVSVVSPTDDRLEVYGTFRTKADINSLYWYSEDTILNDYIKYDTRYDYSDVVLTFDTEYVGDVVHLDDKTISPSLVVVTGDDTNYYVPFHKLLYVTRTTTETIPESLNWGTTNLTHGNIVKESITVKDRNGNLLEEGEWDYSTTADYAIDYSDGLIVPQTSALAYGGTITYSYYVNNSFKIDFNNLYAESYIPADGDGVIEHIKVDPTNIKYVMITLFPTSYEENNYTIIDNIDYKFVMNRITVTNGLLNKENPPIENNPYHICEGFDDVYYFTPRRLAREMRKLGYKDWIDFYIGTSHYYDKNGVAGQNAREDISHPSYERMTLITDYAFCRSFKEWYSDYIYWLQTYDTPNIVISVSLECLQMPESWRQKLADGTYAQTGWVPGTYFYSPCNMEARSFVTKVCQSCLDEIVNYDLPPILQWGEPWWWWQELYPESISIDPNNQNTNTQKYPGQPPAFYDEATIEKYNTETGKTLPRYNSTSVSSLDYGVLDWLQNQLVEYSNFMKSIVKSYDDGQYTVLFFPPSVLDTTRVPEMMQRVNFPVSAWNNDQLDFIQMEDYDWVTADSPAHDTIYSMAKQYFGIDVKNTHYFGGYVQYPKNAKKEWALIVDALESAVEYGIPHVYVWAGTQVRRDNILLGSPTSSSATENEIIEKKKDTSFFNIDRKFPRYPNYDFLQLEEINQTIYNYCRLPFYKWYCINLNEIILNNSTYGSNKHINKSFLYLRYDFTIINCIISDKTYTYTFEIRNTLWTGKWKLTNLDGTEINKDLYTATTDNKNGNILQITGENLDMFLLCLELSNEDKSRHIDTNELIIRFEKEYEFTHQFDVSSYEEVKVINANTNKPIANATVTLVPLTEKREYIDSKLESQKGYPYLKSYTTKTDKNGIARILFNKTITPDIYYGRLEAKYNQSTCYTSVTDKRVQNYTRDVEKVSNLKMYKGEIRSFTFKITPKNKYGIGYNPASETYQVDVYHTYDSLQNVPLINKNETKNVTVKQTVHTNSKGEFTVELSSREFYGDTSTLKFVLPKTQKFDQVTSDTYTINHEWLYAEDINHLKTVCESPKGADAIVLKNQIYTRKTTDSININRKQYILGAKGAGYPTINANSYTPLFNVKKGENQSKELTNMLVLNSIKVVNGGTVVVQEGNCYVQVLNCVFTENKGNDHIGAVIYQNDKTCTCYITNNYFYNNYGNCICGRGDVIIDNNLFKITNVKYTYQPEPFVLEQYSGAGTLKNNQIYVNTSIDYSTGKAVLKQFPTNRSYAKISVWVGKTATVNGKGANQLKSKNTFNFFSPPYNNKAYIFSIYYYPYDNVKTFIVASSSKERINTASGHAVEGCDWAWRDGYNLVRESSKNYSTYNPFVTIKNGKAIESSELYVPTSGGVV